MIDMPERDPLRYAQTLLNEAGNCDLRDVSVDRNGDALVLRGHVTSFYAMQVAQETVRPAVGGLRLVNRLVVGEPIIS